MDDTDELIKTVKEKAQNYFNLTQNDKIVITGGLPSVRLTDFLKIEEINN